MAAISPAVSSQSADAATTTTTPAAVSSPAALLSSTNASKNLRGLNKPKCIKCGNVARSRCPFQSCKSCCAKAQNPCHIHVLKGTSNIPEKLPSSASPKVDQQSADVSHPGSSHRVASLRHLSSSFAQFNNLQSPVRSRKPLTRKDAQVINEWRFFKLKEFKDRESEAENEAFDRYMQNVGLLEEVFAVNTAKDGETDHRAFTTDSMETPVEDSSEALVAGLKLKFRSNPIRVDNIRKRMQYIVDQGLQRLKSLELNDGSIDLSDPDDPGNRPKKKSRRAERASVLSDLIDKLNKARNEEDIRACLEMKAQLLNQKNVTSEGKSGNVDEPEAQIMEDGSTLEPQQSIYSQPKWFSQTTIDQESLCRIDAHFSSLEEIEDL